MLESKAKIKELEKKISELPTQEEYKQALLAKEKAEVETAEIQERNNELSQEMEELKVKERFILVREKVILVGNAESPGREEVRASGRVSEER